ncbi:craniofacial development protein 2-like [Penaeus japonicus]|uniref:craniofacial development protein 2-like n=1 Tax=Penaeus japonicus TaxID=27405 RepID=UPI001C70D1A4|nr:craniofacial development protein 2-like [Penaeus japonicus]
MSLKQANGYVFTTKATLFLRENGCGREKTPKNRERERGDLIMYYPSIVMASQRVKIDNDVNGNISVVNGTTSGTWNINTLYQPGKYENIKQEFGRLKVDIMGLSEVRWEGTGIISDKDITFIYSGGETHQRGVGVMMTANAAKSIAGYWAISDRIILVKLTGKQIDVNLIQVYAPTCDYTDEDIENFYESLTAAKKLCKQHEITLVMGDLNAKIGKGRYEDIVGNFGLGNRNERGDTWIEWCSVEKQVIANSFFQQHPRRLWTWRSPGGRIKNQIDYITINKRFRNSIIRCKTYPGADGGHGCDHVPVIATMKLRLKNIKKRRKQPKKDLQVLSNSEFKERYTVQVRNRFEILDTEQEEESDDKEGKVLMDSKDVLARWVEYVGELYDDERGMKPEYEGELEGPEIMREEILHAMKSMKNRKATGKDEIAIEMIKAAGATECSKHRTISIMKYTFGMETLGLMMLLLRVNCSQQLHLMFSCD